MTFSKDRGIGGYYFGLTWVFNQEGVEGEEEEGEGGGEEEKHEQEEQLENTDKNFGHYASRVIIMVHFAAYLTIENIPLGV